MARTRSRKSVQSPKEKKGRKEEVDEDAKCVPDEAGVKEPSEDCSNEQAEIDLADEKDVASEDEGPEDVLLVTGKNEAIKQKRREIEAIKRLARAEVGCG